LFDQRNYEKFDAFPEVVATINDSETGNDVIEGRQSYGLSTIAGKTASLRLRVAGFALASH
jgi:hypothetical protein